MQGLLSREEREKKKGDREAENIRKTSVGPREIKKKEKPQGIKP